MFGTFIAVGVVLGSFISSSTSIDICSSLDDSPTMDGVIAVGTAIMDQGFSSQRAAEMLVYTVSKSCPEYMPLLFEFADTYGG